MNVSCLNNKFHRVLCPPLRKGYALDSDPDDGADINEKVFDWNAAFQVRTDGYADISSAIEALHGTRSVM